MEGYSVGSACRQYIVLVVNDDEGRLDAFRYIRYTQGC